MPEDQCEILLTTMSTLGNLSNLNYYYYTEKGKKKYCTGVSQLEPGSKYFLSKYPIDGIVVIGSDETHSGGEDDNRTPFFLSDFIREPFIMDDYKRDRENHSKKNAFEFYQSQIAEFLNADMASSLEHEKTVMNSLIQAEADAERQKAIENLVEDFCSKNEVPGKEDGEFVTNPEFTRENVLEIEKIVQENIEASYVEDQTISLANENIRSLLAEMDEAVTEMNAEAGKTPLSIIAKTIENLDETIQENLPLDVDVDHSPDLQVFFAASAQKLQQKYDILVHRIELYRKAQSELISDHSLSPAKKEFLSARINNNITRLKETIDLYMDDFSADFDKYIQKQMIQRRQDKASMHMKLMEVQKMLEAYASQNPIPAGEQGVLGKYFFGDLEELGGRFREAVEELQQIQQELIQQIADLRNRRAENEKKYAVFYFFQKCFPDRDDASALLLPHEYNRIDLQKDNHKMFCWFVNEHIRDVESEGKEKYDNIRGIVERIENAGRVIAHSQGKKDIKIALYIDMQGGSRTSGFVKNAVMQIMNNQEQYRIHIKEIVATNYNFGNKDGNEIVIETNRYSITDLVAGMNEFVKYGKVDTIKKYFEDTNALVTDSEEDRLLKSMTMLDEAVSLGDAELLAQAIVDIRHSLNALENKQEDSYTHQLFDLLKKGIEADYGSLLNLHSGKDKDDAEVDYVEMLHWCIRKGLLQQALTVIEAKMPEVYLGIDTPDRLFSIKAAKRNMEDFKYGIMRAGQRYNPLIHNVFYTMGSKCRRNPKAKPVPVDGRRSGIDGKTYYHNELLFALLNKKIGTKDSLGVVKRITDKYGAGEYTKYLEPDGTLQNGHAMDMEAILQNIMAEMRKIIQKREKDTGADQNHLIRTEEYIEYQMYHKQWETIKQGGFFSVKSYSDYWLYLYLVQNPDFHLSEARGITSTLLDCHCDERNVEFVVLNNKSINYDRPVTRFYLTFTLHENIRFDEGMQESVFKQLMLHKVLREERNHTNHAVRDENRLPYQCIEQMLRCYLDGVRQIQKWIRTIDHRAKR